MQNSFITNNIISQSYKNKSIYNILYKKHGSLVDKILESFSSINIIDEKYEDKYLVNYDLFLSCDPLDHIGYNIKYRDLHIKNAVYIVNDYPKILKKEDRFLLKNQLSNTFKIILSEEIRANWDLFNSSILIPGIPKIIIDKKPIKDILFLNLDNNNSINNIYKNIKTSIKNTDIISNIDSMSLYDIYSLFSSYKLIIDLSHSCFVGGLISLESGCELITNNKYLIDDGAYFLNDDISNLSNQIRTALNSSEIKDREISKKYDFSVFENKMIQYIQQIISEPFIYE